jgi:hypothetical protein
MGSAHFLINERRDDICQKLNQGYITTILLHYRSDNRHRLVVSSKLASCKLQWSIQNDQLAISNVQFTINEWRTVQKKWIQYYHALAYCQFTDNKHNLSTSSILYKSRQWCCFRIWFVILLELYVQRGNGSSFVPSVAYKSISCLYDRFNL